MEFENFKYRLEKSDGMELSVQKTNRPKYEHSKVEFKTVFWCSRNGKKGSTGRGKKTGLSSCPCRLVVKKLKDSDFLEIEYINVHSHPTGIENVKHTNVSKSVREIVETALRAGYQKSTIQSLIEKDKSLKLRDRNISDKEFQRINRRVELQRFGYHSDDSKSVAKWIEALEKTGELKSLKIGNNNTNSFLWSFKIFVNNPTVSLSIVIDEEEKQNFVFLNKLYQNLQNLSYRIHFSSNPIKNMIGYDRSQIYMFWADNFTKSEFVAFVDTDTFFTTKIFECDLFVHGKPRVSPWLKEPTGKQWKKFHKTSTDLIGKTQPFQAMSYFPVILKTKHLSEIRKHIEEKSKNTNFNDVLKKYIRISRKYQSYPSFSQFHIMISYIWYYKKSEYFWDIVSLKSLREPSMEKYTSEAGIKEKDLINYLPRIAVHSKYENMTLSELKIYSLCHFFYRNNFLMPKICSYVDFMQINILQWKFENVKFYRNNSRILEDKRFKTIKNCSFFKNKLRYKNLIKNLRETETLGLALTKINNPHNSRQKADINLTEFIRFI